MLTLNYLQSLLKSQIGEIQKVGTQVIESAGGYDGIVSLVQTKGLSPVVILENSEIGEFGFIPGGFLKSSQSIWVMKMVAKDDDRRKVQDECMAIVKRILSILAEHGDDAGSPLKNWEWDRIPWGVRNAGANYTGYEFTLYFSEDDLDLSCHG